MHAATLAPTDVRVRLADGKKQASSKIAVIDVSGEPARRPARSGWVMGNKGEKYGWSRYGGSGLGSG